MYYIYGRVDNWRLDPPPKLHPGEADVCRKCESGRGTACLEKLSWKRGVVKNSRQIGDAGAAAVGTIMITAH